MAEHEHDDGGSAFPAPETDYTVAAGGMTLLDWFAGQALANGYYKAILDDEGEARSYYDIAQAMIAEKRRREQADA